MNKDKISVQDVIDSLATKTDITKQQADDFFKVLISTIEEALLANDFVKIKNLGTFKLNWVAPRKSVNVQTGEDIEIDGFYRVVFTPEKNLKELVNKPFAHLESVTLDGEEPQKELNPMASLTAQAGTIKTLLTEIQSMSDNETAENQEEKQPETVITKMEEEQHKTIITKMEEETKTKQVERPNYHEYEPEEKKKKRTGWWISLGILLVLGVLVVLYFIPPQNNAFQHKVNKIIFGYDTAEFDAIRARAAARMEKQRIADYQQEETEQEVQPAEQDDFSRAFENRLNNPEILTTVRLNYGSRLAHLAQVHFGSPHFWVYIYEVNRDVVTNPSVIPVGVMIRIPKIDPLLLDLDNPRSMEVIRELRQKYLYQR